MCITSYSFQSGVLCIMYLVIRGFLDFLYEMFMPYALDTYIATANIEYAS